MAPMPLPYGWRPLSQPTTTTGLPQYVTPRGIRTSGHSTSRRSLVPLSTRLLRFRRVLAVCLVLALISLWTFVPRRPGGATSLEEAPSEGLLHRPEEIVVGGTGGRRLLDEGGDEEGGAASAIEEWEVKLGEGILDEGTLSLLIAKVPMVVFS
jgi:hypothetical protein